MSQAESQINEALRLHKAGKLSDAAKIYAKILDIDPSDANALHLLGMLRHEQGHDQTALALVQRAIVFRPQEAVLYNSLGVIQLNLRQYEDARATLERAVSLDPSAAEPHGNLGLVWQQAGQRDAARVCFEEAIRRDRHHAHAHLHLGRLAKEDGKNREAEACFRRAVAADPHAREPYISLAKLLTEQHRHGESRSVLQEAAVRRPADPEVHFELGAAWASQGFHDRAINALEQSLAIQPNSAIAHDQVGSSFLAMGNPGKASFHFQEAVRLDSSTPEYRVHLAKALRCGGRLEEAQEHLERAMKVSKSIEARCELGAQQRERRNHAEAEQLLSDVLRQCPIQPEALFEIAKLYDRCGETGKTVACCVRALKEDGDCVPAHILLGLALSSRLAPEHRAELTLPERRALMKKALAHLQRAAALAPSVETLGALGTGFIQAEKHERAIESLQHAIEISPGFPRAHLDLGKAYLETGSVERAERCFRKSLQLDPLCAEAHYELSHVGRLEDAEMAIPKLSEFLARHAVVSREQMLARFALARYLDCQGDHDAAFEEYLRANALKKELPGGEQAVRKTRVESIGGNKQVDRQVSVFNESFLHQRKGWGNDSDLPVFIVGMPRSGTTLVEQILASHPCIYGAGELIDISDLAISLPRRIGTGGRYPDVVPAATEGMVDELALEYLAELRKRGGAAIRITDKMPTNFWHLGFISLLLPRSRVIHVIRDPRDVCVSCLKQNLAWPFCDLEAVGRYYHNYQRLMQHWKSVLSLEMLDVHYEDLVSDCEAESRRILDFCGLPWDNRCLDFANNDRVVQTPSKWQVRKPVYTSSAGGWKKYAAHLQPLLNVLEGYL